jgi:hypothetical protein
MAEKKSLIIAVDFDGTCVTNSFPNVGEDIDGAAQVLKRLVEAGHRLILYTCRSWGAATRDAVQWFRERGIELYGVNHDYAPPFVTASPKLFYNILIDDRALGCPTLEDVDTGGVCVDWVEVEKILVRAGVLDSEK